MHFRIASVAARLSEFLPQVSAFYQHKPELDSVLSVAKKLTFPDARRAKSLDPAPAESAPWLWPGNQRISIRLKEGAVAVVSGQQLTLWWSSVRGLQSNAALRIAKD